MVLLLFASVPACIALQLYIWITWRGAWRLIGRVPVLALIAGCIHGILQNSNLWPFWVTEYAPYGLLFGVALFVIRFLRFRLRKSVRVDGPV
jgi:hypothetical protein